VTDEPSDDVDMMTALKLEPVSNLQEIRGIGFDRALKFNQILVTGPPASGKSSLVRGIGGWPEEGYIDLTMKGWWRAPNLVLRPREVHLGLPFVGRPAAMTVYDEYWLAHWRELTLELPRILIPPASRHFLSVNWRSRFAFEFLLPPADVLVRRTRERAKLGTHPFDQIMEPEQMRRQLGILTQTALYLHRQGMNIYVRTTASSSPARIIDAPSDHAHG